MIVYFNVDVIHFLLATDDNTTIYTVVTGGTDQLVKLWRIYSLRDLKSSGTSRLIPTGPLVVVIQFDLKFFNKRTFSNCISIDLFYYSILNLRQEHLCGNSVVVGTATMNAECVLTITAHGSSVTGVK